MGSVDISLPHKHLKQLMPILRNLEFPQKVRHVTFASIEDVSYGNNIKETHSEEGFEEEKKLEDDEDFNLEGEGDDEETTEHHRVNFYFNGSLTFVEGNSPQQSDH